VAAKDDEVSALIEAGLEYVIGEYDDSGKIFRKPSDYVSQTETPLFNVSDAGGGFQLPSAGDIGVAHNISHKPFFL
jgi:hypothetical protein